MVEIVHRTNYWGDRIEFRSYVQNEPCLWFQASNFEYGCCRRFGRRVVPLDETDFQRWGVRRWKLWLIEINAGINPEHFFHKMVLIPFGTPGLGRPSCEGQGWKYLSTIHNEPMRELEQFLSTYLGKVKNEDIQNGNETNKNHLHFGIMQPGEDAYLCT